MASSVILIAGIHPNAPVPRARETLRRLLVLMGHDMPEPPAPPSKPRPRLTLIRGGKQDDPVKPSAA